MGCGDRGHGHDIYGKGHLENKGDVLIGEKLMMFFFLKMRRELFEKRWGCGSNSGFSPFSGVLLVIRLDLCVTSV